MADGWAARIGRLRSGGLARTVWRLCPRSVRAGVLCRLWRKRARLRPARAGAAAAGGIHEAEYGVLSQHGEDGILDFLIGLIGEKSRLFLEFGFSPLECNCLLLAMERRFGGVFIDGDELNASDLNKAASLFGLENVHAIRRLLNRENIEKTIRQAGLSGDIDVLSIDVDGNDFWLWEALRCVSPRIVVIEYNASLGPDRSITVPYDPSFERSRKHPSGWYHGASLEALVRLGRRKGYRLVGCDSMGVNAFFVREDCVPDELPPVPARQAYRDHKGRLRRGFSADQQFEMISDMPFDSVD